MDERMQDRTTLTFKIDKNDKAIVYVKKDQNTKTSCLIDTGAGLPVWFSGEDYLRYRFQGVSKTEYLTILNGLGHKPLYDIPIWNIPDFTLTDDDGKQITFKGLKIAIYDTDRFSVDMIIPLTMLNRMDFSFEYTKNARYGEFCLSIEKDIYYIEPIFAKSNRGYLNKIQVMMEE